MDLLRRLQEQLQLHQKKRQLGFQEDLVAYCTGKTFSFQNPTRDQNLDFRGRIVPRLPSSFPITFGKNQAFDAKMIGLRVHLERIPSQLQRATELSHFTYLARSLV